MVLFAEGLTFGKYEIKSIPAGGFAGEIYRARDTESGRDVYLRILSHSCPLLLDGLDSIQSQIASAAAITHPHVLPVREIGCSGEVLFAVSDFVEGESLRQKLHRTRLTRERASDYGIQIARALAAIHSAGLYHSDLKPESILITKEGTLRVMDAGLASLSFAEGEAAPDTAPILIADYASPEQVRGEPETWRSDLFSWGVIVFEMLSGVRPFLRNSLPATTSAILNENVPDLKSPALDRIIRQALRKQPEQRFDSARDMAFAIESFGGLTTPVNKIRKTVRTSYTTPFLIAAAMLTLGLAMGALIARRYLRPTVTSQLSFEPLTLSGHDSEPSASADGKTVVFVSDRDGKSRIWMRHLDSHREVPVSDGPDHAPRISPDGKSVLFLRDRELFTTDASGGTPKKILHDVSGADWGPRADKVLWLRVGAGLSILGTANPSGEDARELTRVSNQVLEMPRWSRDGKYVGASITADDGSRSAVFVAPFDSPGTHHVLPPPPGPGALSGIAWLAGSRLIYVRGASNGVAEIVRQDANTAATSSLGFSHSSAVTVDVLGPGLLLFDTSSGHRNLEEITVGSGRRKVLTMGETDAEEPAYSPDGKRIYFSSFQGGGLRIWMMDRMSGGYSLALSSNGRDTEPFLSADGSRLFWTSSRDGHWEIYSAKPDGSYFIRVTHEGTGAEHPSMGNDGKWLVYNSSQRSPGGVRKSRPTGQDESDVVRGDTHWPEASPNGRYILYTAVTTGEREIRVASMDTGKPFSFCISLPFVASGGNPSLGRAKWMPGGQGIAFIGEGENGGSELFSAPFSPNTPNPPRRRLIPYVEKETIHSFAISPDGRQVTVAAWERGSTIIQAENVPGVSR